MAHDPQDEVEAGMAILRALIAFFSGKATLTLTRPPDVSAGWHIRFIPDEQTTKAQQ